MKKLLLGLLITVVMQGSLLAQGAKETGFSDVKGVNFFNAGIGLGSYGLSGTGGLPVTASFEHGFTKNITAGLGLGFIQKKYVSDWKYTYLLFGARGSYHFNEALKVSNPKLDVYGGAGLFYRHFSFKYTDATGEGDFNYNSSGGNLDFELHAGARYLFGTNIGAYAELGYGISPLQLGLTFKF